MAVSQAHDVFGAALVKPQQHEQPSPCNRACAAGGDVRGWLALLGQQRKLSLSLDEARLRAWRVLTEANPFPAVLGRVCPHPCQDECNRSSADGAVAVSALERFLGDWALKTGIPLARLSQETMPESVAVVGAGPAGLSFAYQLARRGYRVTIYEKEPKPGGMLRYGIPRYRLPEAVLDAEIARVLALGITLKTGATAGRDLALAAIQAEHAAVFLGIGAGRGLNLGIPGEEGAGTWTGIDFLARLANGQRIDLGSEVLVVGGGNTAIDAARTALRGGSRVTLVYRRTRAEMPAIAREVEDALAEGIQIAYLCAPTGIRRVDGTIRAVVLQRMALAEPDASGRRRPVPVPGSEFELGEDAVIAAVSQQPDWQGWGEWDGLPRDSLPEDGRVGDLLWAGGDVVGAGIAATAVAQGRRAAEAVHARLRGKDACAGAARAAIPPDGVKKDYYRERNPVGLRQIPVAERLCVADAEVNQPIGEEECLSEAGRCFSCGQCFGCQHCFMYCNAGAFSALAQPKPGAYFALSLDNCESCGKCIELCPSGFLSAQPAAGSGELPLSAAPRAP